jgi:hypothetical protein
MRHALLSLLLSVCVVPALLAVPVLGTVTAPAAVPAAPRPVPPIVR